MTTSNLIDHLQKKHKYEVEIQALHFTGFESFLLWKDEEETKTHSSFVQQCAPQTYASRQHWYYYCNRSGTYKSKTKGVRCIKSQGTCKTGQRCIAHIKATKHLVTGEVDVQYCKTHHNHEVSLGHLRMPNATRMKIVTQLQQGVTIERIMDNIRENTVGGITREHLLTRQDVYNIKNQYNIEGVIRHSNDLCSVRAYVEELRSLTYNPVLLFKVQGELQSDDMDNIGNDDFILGIQTQFNVTCCVSMEVRVYAWIPPMALICMIST